MSDFFPIEFEGGVVDQTYNPTSQNAQSGTAVEEAFNNKNKKGRLNKAGSADANDFDHLSCYFCHPSAVSNVPDTQKYWIIFTLKPFSNYAYQIANCYNDGSTHIRRRTDAGWQAWSKVKYE